MAPSWELRAQAALLMLDCVEISNGCPPSEENFLSPLCEHRDRGVSLKAEVSQGINNPPFPQSLGAGGLLVFEIARTNLFLNTKSPFATVGKQGI